MESSYKCYYCEHDTNNIHLVTFYKSDHEHDELLCDECYVEWLASLKG